MKNVILLFVISFLGLNAQAQTCKIKIYYDANGNRIQRVLECTAGKPAPDEAPLKTETKQTNTFSDLAHGRYQVYPNPAENKLNVKLDTDLLSEGCDLFMTDLSGKMLYQRQNVSNAVSEIDLQGLADGTYFIIITYSNERHTVKIVKQTGNGY